MKCGYNVMTFDFTSAYPHADELEEVYILAPPEWYDLYPETPPGSYLQLLKQLYGRRTAARGWQDHFIGVLEELGG
eukprot:9779888-Alexandrium_andersonii.AAC.1